MGEGGDLLIGLAFVEPQQRLLLCGKSKACAIGALMNKLMRFAYGVLKHQTPFADNLAKV